MLRKKILATAAAGALTLSALAATAVTTAAPAEAANVNGCTGSIIASRTITDTKAKKVVGYLYLLYNSSTRQNCATTSHSSATWGQKLSTSVWMATSYPNDKYAFAKEVRSDSGVYAYYAGPVKLNGYRLCVAAQGSITTNNGTFGASIPRGFCGG